MFFQLSHHLPDAINGFDGVVARQLKDIDNRRGRIVQPPDYVVGLRSQFDPSDVFHPHNRTILVLPNDHVAEILFCHQATLRAHRVGEFLARRSRLGSYLAGRINRILLLKRLHQIGNGNPQACQLIRLHPLAHGIGARSLYQHGADTPDAGQSIDDVDVCIVSQEFRVSRALRGGKGDDHQGANVRFCNRDSLVTDRGRKLGKRPVYSYLGKHFRDVRIQIEIEIDPQLHGSIVGVERPHVQHAFDTRHRFFDWRCN